MNSTYFVIEIYKRGQLQTIVEMEKLSRVARFTLDTEQYRVNTHYECKVCINLAYVCGKQMIGLEQFTADSMDDVKRLALGH